MIALKEALMTSPALTIPTSTGRIAPDKDACTFQDGCVHLPHQEHETTKPTGYWSGSLTDAESKYDTTQWECLAIVWDVLIIRPYLEGIRLTIRTDHDSVKTVLSLVKSTRRLALFCLRLSEFEFDIFCRAGIEHQAAEAFSRLPTTEEDDTPLEDDLPLLATDTIENHCDTQICVVDTTKTDDVPVEYNNSDVALYTRPTEKEFPIIAGN